MVRHKNPRESVMQPCSKNLLCDKRSRIEHHHQHVCVTSSYIIDEIMFTCMCARMATCVDAHYPRAFSRERRYDKGMPVQ